RDSGAIAVLREDAMHPQDIWLAAPKELGVGSWELESRPPTPNSQLPTPGKWRQLTCMHSQVAELALGETRELRWQSADGEEIQGLLILPAGYTAGQRGCTRRGSMARAAISSRCLRARATRCCWPTRAAALAGASILSSQIS